MINSWGWGDMVAPFQNGNFSKRKEFAPIVSELFPLRVVPYGMENHFYQIR